MLIIDKIKNKFVLLVLALIIITIIGYTDYITGTELSFSIFYLFPIALIALYDKSSVVLVLICSIFSSFLWFFAEYYQNNLSGFLIPFWNTGVRLIFFTAIGLLLFFLKEKQKKLNSINSRLKDLNEEKNKMIGIAAHDLRNPMGGIFSFSNLLVTNYKDKISPDVIEILNIIRDVSNNMLAIIQNLLNISKIESGKVELKITNQDYILFVKQHISLNQMLASNKNIIIKFDSHFDSQPADFDKQYLSEVIDNLLSNAIKYSDYNSEIIVNVSRTDGMHLLTEIIDKGYGIPDDEQKKLFNYFQKTSTQPTAGEQSTGLGLAIAKQIITLHHGKIGLKSAVNQGSTFYFTIPIKR